MASALLGTKVERATELHSAAVPAWWRQSHTYALAVMVAAHLVAFVAMPWTLIAESDAANELMQGAMVGDCLLLGMWAALGGLRAIPRWLTVLGVFLSGVAALQLRWNSWANPEAWEGMIYSGMFAWMVVAMSAVVLVPLRGLLGWRIDFDAAYYRHIQTRRGQVSFMQIAAYTCCVAVPLAVLNILASLDGGLEAAELLSFFAFTAMLCAAAWGTALLVLKLRPWLAIPAAGLSTLAFIYLHSALALVLDDFAGVTWSCGMCLELARIDLAIALTVIVTLLPLRRFGLRLLVVGLPRRD